MDSCHSVLLLFEPVVRRFPWTLYCNTTIKRDVREDDAIKCSSPERKKSLEAVADWFKQEPVHSVRFTDIQVQLLRILASSALVCMRASLPSGHPSRMDSSCYKFHLCGSNTYLKPLAAVNGDLKVFINLPSFTTLAFLPLCITNWEAGDIKSHWGLILRLVDFVVVTADDWSRSRPGYFRSGPGSSCSPEFLWFSLWRKSCELR